MIYLLVPIMRTKLLFEQKTNQLHAINILNDHSVLYQELHSWFRQFSV